jgi:hypothetical protein
VRAIAWVALVTACHTQAASRPRDPPPVPESFAYHPITPGVSIEPRVDSNADDTPVPALVQLVRAWYSLSGELYVFDVEGHVAAASNRGVHVLPFSEPVRALILHDQDGGSGITGVLASGDIEDLIGHERRHYHLEAPVIAGNGYCFQAKPGEALACYQVNTPRLQRRSRFGPPTPAELAALQRVSEAELLQWRRAVGPAAIGATQIDGTAALRFEAGEQVRPHHVCGVLADHTVACWGSGLYGELGDGQHSNAPRLARVAGLGDVVEVATGNTHTCARDRAGRVACWGDAASGAFPAAGGTSTLTSCPVDREATEKHMTELRARAHEAAEACMQRTCAPGTLDCHLGCVYREPPADPIFDRSRPCTDRAAPRSGVAIVDKPQVLAGITDAISLTATDSGTCVVHATGRLDCWSGPNGAWSRAASSP